MHYLWTTKHTKSIQTIDEIIKLLLIDRGIENDQQKLEFLDPSFLKVLPKIFTTFDDDAVSASLSFVTQAIQQNEPIVIHGDYDADGICATAIMWETFYRILGYENTHPFIPHREEHGYGVSKESIDAILEKHGSNALVITVDCGITAKESVLYGQQKGLQFIVTDHHTIQEGKVPAEVPVIHTYELCGAGIAWAWSLMLKQHVLQLDAIETYQEGLDLAALATIADIQSVLGFNRAILKEGLPLITNTSRVGLKELLMQAGLLGKKISTYEIGWVIAPRLNALGRLEHALDSVRLLLTTNNEKAIQLVQRMNVINGERQELTQSAFDEAVEIVLKNNWQDNFAIVIESDSWHEGILGLIAGKLVERFYVPVIVLGKSGETYKGSARSISGCNVIDAIKEHDSLLIDAGGHAMAAGLSVQQENIESFRIGFNKTVQDTFDGVKPQKVFVADCIIPSTLLTLELVNELTLLSPFGIDNPRPVFRINSLIVANKREVGKEGKHLSLTLTDDEGNTFKAIWFNNGSVSKDLGLGAKIDCVCTLEVDTYREPQVQLVIKDMNIL